MGRTISEKEMKERYGGTNGIIAMTFYEVPQVSRYGTLDDFLRIAKKKYERGEIRQKSSDRDTSDLIIKPLTLYFIFL